MMKDLVLNQDKEQKQNCSSTDISETSLKPFSCCASSVVVFDHDTHQFQETDVPVPLVRQPSPTPRATNDEKKEIRIFIDGVFDLMHFGHMNAFRLARSLGTHLIVGVTSDESVRESKGPTLLNAEERIAMVSATKFVDQVVPDIPYVMTQDDIDSVIEKYNIDFFVHGDDPCILNGVDLYEDVKKAGKFKSIPRTEGVSTTDIIGRLLRMTSDNKTENGSNLAGSSKFFMTGSILQAFSASVKPPMANMRIVYIDGTWDMFHRGHVAILEEARKRGDYLIVGVHGDTTSGEGGTVLNLHERVLSVFGCQYADDVLIDAPHEISPDMIASLRISEVVCVLESEDVEENDRFQHVKAVAVLQTMERPTDFSIDTIVDRINANRETWDAKFERKAKEEKHFYQEKYSLANV